MNQSIELPYPSLLSFLCMAMMTMCVPVKVFHETESHLKDAGFEVRSHLMSGVRHEIPPAAIDVILKFMKQRLGAGG